jgi:ligand-binding sensor domain-containing protein
MRLILCLLILVCAVTSWSQDNTPAYTWRMHLPYNSVRDIVQVDQQLYVLSDVGVYIYDLPSGEVEYLTKVDGFSESFVSALAYSELDKCVIIGYKSGNIDLVKGDRIINLAGIKRSDIIGGKDIYEIKISGHLAYLATPFGVVVVDLENEEIVDDYQNLGFGGISLAVRSLDILNDTLYIATTEGLKYAPANNASVNLKNFSSWNTNEAYDSAYLVFSHNSSLYFVSDRMLYKYKNKNYSQVENAAKDYLDISSTLDNLVVVRKEGIAVIDVNESISERAEPSMSAALLDSKNNLWFGGFYTGMIKKSTSNELSYLFLPGPYGLNSYDMDGVGNQLWVTSGGHTTAYAPSYISFGYYIYQDGRWVNRDESNPIVGSMIDFTNICIADNEVWLGSFGAGLAVIRDGTPAEYFNKENSTIKESVPGREIVFGMAKDTDGNLWAANFATDKPLILRRPNGSWTDFNVGTQNLGEMVVDDQNQVWILVPRNSSTGLLVVKELENGQLEKRFLNTTSNQGGLPSNNVKAIVKGKDGQIWIGTETGIAVFYNPNLVFDGGPNADAQQIIIDDGSDIGYLLGNEVVNDIKVDGGNRKWIATNNGAWLVEEDGSGIIDHFTTANSPLPSNVINTIGIVPKTGEVFFGTIEGIASYRGDATEATDKHSGTIVFPNPVEPGYEGPITISGLPEDATVKIADIAGRVVYELIATGGTAVWNGLDFNGQKPQSGIYLIFSANKDDEDSLVSKLLIVR